MGETVTVTVAPSSSLRKISSFSPSVRFLGVLRQPDPEPAASSNHMVELDESDVVWSSAGAAEEEDEEVEERASSSNSSTPRSGSLSAAFSSYAPPAAVHRPRRTQFRPGKSGLSAALAEETAVLMQRRKTAAESPPLSAARAIPVSRSGSEESLGSRNLFQMSAPVKIPAWPGKGRGGGGGDAERRRFGEVEEWGGLGEVGEEDPEKEGEMVPPHVMVARSHVMAFSVFEGAGRTLKGRDLRRVRNAVLQKTGFLD